MGAGPRPKDHISRGRDGCRYAFYRRFPIEMVVQKTSILTNSGEGSKNCLYRNQGDGTFKDVAGELGIADLNQPGTGVSMGERSGAIMTTMAMTISFFTSGAARSCSTTMVASISRALLNKPACHPG